MFFDKVKLQKYIFLLIIEYTNIKTNDIILYYSIYLQGNLRIRMTLELK